MNSGFPADPAPPRSEAFTSLAAGIESLVQYDPGGRGLAHWAERGDLYGAARALAEGTRIAITTGFHIPANGVIETDGPIGAIVLARSLLALGKDVTLLVDQDAAAVITAGAEATGGTPPELILLPPGDSRQLRQLASRSFSHMVAVERPGRSADGRYLTMRGEDISSHVAATDELFLAPGRRYTTIAIGDGGNELGLGAVADRVDRFLAVGSAGGGTEGAAASTSISCRTPADLCIHAGVSNWGAYGLCAMLERLTGIPLLPEVSVITGILHALVRAGAVDGIHRAPVPSVDGLPWEEETGVLLRLREALQEAERPTPAALPVSASRPEPVPLGDAALLWSWPGGISRETSARVLAAYRRLRDDPALRRAGMVDVVPAYNALAVHFAPLQTDRAALLRRAGELLEEPAEPAGAVAGTVHRLPVTYNGEDLPRVAQRAGLSSTEVVNLHVTAEYTVAMIGFRPHFPYLIGMDERIATPRLDRPRTRVPAGSVGIAGSQTGVYPIDSPGGWNVIGTTNPSLLPAIRPGDTVIFEEVE